MKNIFSPITRLLALLLSVLIPLINSAGIRMNRQTAFEQTQRIVADADPAFTETLAGFHATEAAAQAISLYYEHFWQGSAITGHIQNETESMIWEAAMGLFAMEAYFEATGESETFARIHAEWNYLRARFGREKITGNMGGAPNIAADDAGWTAMALLSVYRVTGSLQALRWARENIKNAYAYFGDNDLFDGMWYCNETQYRGDRWKSVYSVSFLIAALEYCRVTQNTVLYDDALYEQTLRLYDWMQENLCRDGEKTYADGLQDGFPYTVTADDGLYWCDFNCNRTGRTEKNGPDGGTRPYDISHSGSVSSLFGNMGMAAVNGLLFRMTGEELYRARALKTVRSLTRIYDTGETTFLNDRDHNTDAALANEYVRYALTLDGVNRQDINILMNTGRTIALYGKTEDGFYNTDWRENHAAPTDECGICAVMGTNVAMIAASALAECFVNE